ncbi:acyltransferase [Maritimibacter sp. HL-12]|uniref:acyltransferase n=1 Tax=Maritimibacter sp. HL-12 TaxID=1162418 RepID=UPI000A0F1F17|nr:acyltransferase [Maritimibacter sp. HL-12]SMH54623.1 galactoside O-acetyltransferase [Maritimibacter sp. HL-12]
MSMAFNSGYAESEELLQLGFARVGHNVRIARNCTIIGFERIAVGDNVRIDGPTTIVVAEESFVEIGSYVHIGGGCHLSATVPLRLGDFSGLSQGVRIFTATDDYSGKTLTNPMVPARYKRIETGPVILGRHVIVGAGTVILPGACIGEGSSVGALSLVSRPLPEWQVCAGTPCRALKAREKDLLSLERELRAEDSGVASPFKG